MTRKCNLSTPSPRRLPLAVAILVLFIFVSWQRLSTTNDVASYSDRYPLSWRRIHLKSTPAGAWYIPPHWLGTSDLVPETIFKAAQFAARLAVNNSHTIPHSDIPLLIHQTWKNTDIATWEPEIAKGVEQWLAYATAGGNASMAYFLWRDEGEGCRQVVGDAEPDLVQYVDALPLKVEKLDVFRIVLLNSIGGVYGDIDTIPLRSPASWLDETDLLPWTDPIAGVEYATPSNTSIRLLLGIEGDNDPSTDAYWRMGYTFPIQLTQWALASAPQHPILARFISNFAERVKQLRRIPGEIVSAAALSEALGREDPLKLTGPDAITLAAKEWLELAHKLRWDGLTGLKDGGRSKAVGDTVIFPITAFSPGRGRFGNMGSKPITDADARVLHFGQGSWKKMNLRVEVGKLCRTLFGLCRDWSKVL